VNQKGAFDYVLLCIKALPDVYDLASVIESVVTPQHTCILINTSHSLGIESFIEKRFPKNVVLSLVSKVDIAQLGPAEFEHRGSTDLWVGPANWNSEIPASIQTDMAEALAMTLGSGQVDCKVSKNIQQQQFERMAGYVCALDVIVTLLTSFSPIAFHTASVLFETPNHAELLELAGVRALISDTIDEIIQTGQARNCRFSADFKEKAMEEMISTKEAQSTMYQDYVSKRPMEVETYLGSPIKLAREAGVKVPRIQTLYALLHHVNIANQKRQSVSEPQVNGAVPMSRMSGPPQARGPGPYGFGPAPGRLPGPMNPSAMNGRGSRAPSVTGQPMRRGPPPGMNGYGPPTMPQRGPGPVMRDSSNDDGLGQEFSHLMLYNGTSDGYQEGAGGHYTESGISSSAADLALRERELMLRQKEIALREREMHMRAGPGMLRTRGPPPPASHVAQSQIGGYEDDDDQEDYFDPMAYRGPPVDPDNIDMMSVTSRRTRKQPSNGQLRNNSEGMSQGARRGNPFARSMQPRTASAKLLEESPMMGDPLLDNPLVGYSSDRYGNVDRRALGVASRTNSLTNAKLSELQQGSGYGGYPAMNKRTSQSPGNQLTPGLRISGRPSPPGQGYSPNGPSSNRILPLGPPPDMRQPTPRHPPGHGNSVAPHQVEQRAGVSNLYPPKGGPQGRSLTGSASASAGSGDSGQSANIDSENSAFSSQSSLGPRPVHGIGAR